MPFQVQCPCGQVYSLPETLCGKQARCKVCQQLFVVPDAPVVQESISPPTQHSPAQQPPTAQQPSLNDAARENPIAASPQHNVPTQIPPTNIATSHAFQHPLSPPQGFAQQTQVPNALGMPQAFQNSPLHPTGNPNSGMSRGPSNKKLWIVIGSSAGGVALVVLLLVFLLNGNSGEQGDPELATGGQGNSSKADSKEASRSEHGLFELVKFHDLGTIRKSWVYSKNKTAIAVCTHKPKAATVTIVDLANPSVTETETLDGPIKLLGISNDANFLAYETGGWQKVLNRSSGQTIPTGKFVEFTGDSKYGLMKHGNNGWYCFSLDTPKIVWSRIQVPNGATLSSDVRNWASFSAGDLARGDFVDGSEKKTAISMLYGTSEFSSNLRYAMVTKQETLVIADLETQKKVAELNGLKFPDRAKIWSSISAEGNYAVIMQAESETDRFVSLIDVQKGEIVDNIPNYNGNAMFLSDDGNYFVAMVKNGVQIWKLKRPSGASPLPSNPAPYFTSLSERQRIPFANDPRITSLNKILSVKSEVTAPPEKVFSNSAAAIGRTVKRSNVRLEGLPFANSYLLSGNQRFLGIGVNSQSMARGTITVWDTQSGFLPEVVEGTNRERLLGISHDGILVATKELRNAGNVGPHRVTIYNREEKVKAFEIIGVVGNRAFFSSDNTRMLLVYNGHAAIWDPRTKHSLPSFTIPAVTVHDVSRDFKSLVEITNETIVTFDIATKERIAVAKRPKGKIQEYGCISMDTQRVVTISSDRISVYNYGTNKLIGELLLDSKLAPAKVKLSRDGSKLICHSSDSGKQHLGFIASVSESSVKRLGGLPIPKGAICMDFELSNDGKRMFTICRNGTEGGHVVLSWKLK